MEQDKTVNLEKESKINEEEEQPIINYHYIPRNYARSRVEPMFTNPTSTIASQFTIEQVNKMLRNPYTSYKQLQMVNDYILATNRNYENFLDYFANIMTLHYTLYPTVILDKKKTMKNRLLDAAKTVSKINLENVFPFMAKQVLQYGETYWYDLSDGSNTIIIDLPRDICVLSYIDDDNLWRYYVDVALIKPNLLYELPEEIQRAYKRFVDAGKPRGKCEEEGFCHLPKSYYQVSNKGFAIFGHMKKKPHDYPLMSNMFTEFLTTNENKIYFNEYIRDAQVKTIHQKVPLDPDTGKPTMPREVIETYHASSKESVGKNISIMTNPFDVEGISLDSSQQNTINLVDHDLKVEQNSSGISETIFNANTTNGLTYSTEKDAAKMYPLLYFFTNFVNFKIKDKKFAINFLHTNIFNKKDVHEQYRTDLLSGGSRSLFIATSGVDMHTYLNTLEMEDILDIDEMLKPKLNASQQSSDDVGSENGRPNKKEEDKSESTIKVDENS